MISLSGGVDYRSNNLTGSDGSITFVGLVSEDAVCYGLKAQYVQSPGEYFIRPVLKEYKFEPLTQMVAVAEGKRLEVRTAGVKVGGGSGKVCGVEVSLEGEQVAYSGHGRLEYLSGEPVVGAVVAALAGPECGGLEEEGRTADDGAFRVRALKPDCPYTLRYPITALPLSSLITRFSRLKSHPDVQATIPESLSISLSEKKDIYDIRLIAAPVWKTLEVGTPDSSSS